jgi:phage protein D
MPVVSVVAESRQQRGFYVPQFEVRVQGMGLPQDVVRDVIQVTYKDDIKTIDSFELTVNNWNPQTNQFKYVGAETEQSLEAEDERGRHFRLFEPCRHPVEVWLGYLGTLRLMVKGSFTTLEPNFPSSGAPTLTVRGLNVLHQLRRKQYSGAWENQTDSAIAENIATLRDRETGRQRFPLPIVVDDNSRTDEEPIDYVAQKSQYDIDFLFERARERGYVVVVLEPDETDRRQRLYFGRSNSQTGPGPRLDTFRLEWGRSLIEFKPTLTTANQVRSVTVNGWNRRRGEPITETVRIDDRRLKRQNPDLHRLLSENCDAREEIVVDEPVFTTQQARNRAIAILAERQREMVRASGLTVGLPDLRAGRRIVIGGLGARFSGTYFVTDTTHTLGGSGYTTRFNARREDSGQDGGA